MMTRLSIFLLAWLAELAARLSYADGFVSGAMRAAYERGYARGYGSEEEETQPVLDD